MSNGSLEHETKLRVDDLSAVRDRLASLGATPVRVGVEDNLIFDREDGWLRTRGCGLRIRAVEVEQGDAVPAILTFKGPQMPGPIKVRPEVETVVGDGETARQILQGIGYQLRIHYQKRRETWRCQDCLVELDTPPHIGTFVEIEGPSAGAIDVVKSALGLAGLDHVDVSYVAMLLSTCAREGLDPLRLELPA